MSGEGELAGLGWMIGGGGRGWRGAGVACGGGGGPEGLTKPPLLSLISERVEIIRRSEAGE